MPRWQATEFLDAEDIPYAPDAEPRTPRYRRRRRAATSPTVGQVARAVVATYAAWVFCWWLVRTGVPPPHGLEWFRALLVHLPTPPPF